MLRRKRKKWKLAGVEREKKKESGRKREKVNK